MKKLIFLVTNSALFEVCLNCGLIKLSNGDKGFQLIPPENITFGEEIVFLKRSNKVICWWDSKTITYMTKRHTDTRIYGTEHSRLDMSKTIFALQRQLRYFCSVTFVLQKNFIAFETWTFEAAKIFMTFKKNHAVFFKLTVKVANSAIFENLLNFEGFSQVAEFSNFTINLKKNGLT